MVLRITKAGHTTFGKDESIQNRPRSRTWNRRESVLYDEASGLVFSVAFRILGNRADVSSSGMVRQNRRR